MKKEDKIGRDLIQMAGILSIKHGVQFEVNFDLNYIDVTYAPNEDAMFDFYKELEEYLYRLYNNIKTENLS